MKYLLVLLAALIVTVQAQTVSINLTNAIPTGDFSQSVNLGYAGGVSLQYPVFDYTAEAYIGYGLWDEASNPTGNKLNFTNWPIVLVGLRSYVGNFYVKTLAGSYPVELTVEGEKVSKDTYFSALGAIGYVFPVSFFDLDISAGYLWNGEYPQVNIGLAVMFFR